MSVDKDAQSRAFVQDLEEYNHEIKMLKEKEGFLTEDEKSQLTTLENERHTLIMTETKEAMETKDVWLSGLSEVEAAQKEIKQGGVKAKEQVLEAKDAMDNLNRDDQMQEGIEM